MLTLNKKIIIISFLILLFFSLFCNNVFAMPSPTYDFYVNDSANIIDSSTEDYIIDINKKLYNQTGAQIVVVTVKNLEGRSIEQYSTELFRSYGIGSKEKNNGILFIVSVEDRKTRIEVGYGLEGKLNDAKTGRILDDYVVPYFKDNNWNDGIKNGFNAILKEVREEYNVTIDGAQETVDKFSMDSFQIATAIICFILALINKHIFSKSALKKWLSALAIGIIATIIGSGVSPKFVFEDYLVTNMIGVLLGTLGLRFILESLIYGGFDGFGGGSSGGGSSRGGGSSGGGGSSRSF